LIFDRHRAQNKLLSFFETWCIYLDLCLCYVFLEHLTDNWQIIPTV